MWKGRFQKETSSLLTQYGESISFDWRLYKYDIAGSIAHAAALEKSGIITQEECKKITEGLRDIGTDIEQGSFEFDMNLEDIHMNIESALTERIGDAGAKLHTARSRNDQVALDVRLYCRDSLKDIQENLRDMQRALVQCCKRFPESVIPGYTHLQRGQPVLFSHHLLAYVEMFERDLQRLKDSTQRINVMPLGSGALAGSTITLDREFIAEQLGFAEISQNSMDAVSDRDFVAEVLFCLALTGTHLSRLSEDIILWASAEFEFVTLSDEHTTGSSLMPQKKNPDIAELTRGKTGRLYGNLMSILTLMKGLPMTYNRDLQEDKEPLFDSIDTIQNALVIFSDMIDGMCINEDQTLEACTDPMLFATDIADYLVKKDVPFREAHHIVGELTAHAIEKNTPFPEIEIDKYKEFSDQFDESVFDLFDVKSALNARSATGAPSPKNVSTQISKWENKLSSE
ncbi:MAG: argininosuccinate lyase [Verrucomicrobiota bacterium]|nr:argininosuccinate lyase [Verrucomicrobiota bacterium]MEE2968378.1 argininosuccinate lyase [Verrucomicrobiota bacterium]